ncbi:MAG: hypothetical protein LBK13_05670, partial [Spirochaetales bacterium]|nr:hypothetical protein [Spirochaetales bacterium]
MYYTILFPHRQEGYICIRIILGAFRGCDSSRIMNFLSESDRLRAHFFARKRAKKPGFPLQSLAPPSASSGIRKGNSTAHWLLSPRIQPTISLIAFEPVHGIAADNSVGLSFSRTIIPHGKIKNTLPDPCCNAFDTIRKYCNIRNSKIGFIGGIIMAEMGLGYGSEFQLLRFL